MSFVPGVTPITTPSTVNTTLQNIYMAWQIDPSWVQYIYWTWVIMYFQGIIPSIFGMPFILVSRGFVNIYLFVDMWLRLAGLAFHDAKEAYIWTLGYWFQYSFRRWIVDLLIIPLHFFTQSIPFANWLLNLLPFYLHYANAIDF